MFYWLNVRVRVCTRVCVRSRANVSVCVSESAIFASQPANKWQFQVKP